MASTLLHRPIYGGVFGRGRYALASVPRVSRGLHSTTYMVVQPQDGVVLSVADDKVEALAGARRLLSAANDLHASEASEQRQIQAELWTEDELPASGPVTDTPHVSRRRREIFERSNGKCLYCGTPLDLTGKWHIEHQLPRALGGDDRPINLVAACVPCNLAKSDSTAIEFVAEGRAEQT